MPGPGDMSNINLSAVTTDGLAAPPPPWSSEPPKFRPPPCCAPLLLWPVAAAAAAAAVVPRGPESVPLRDRPPDVKGRDGKREGEGEAVIMAHAGWGTAAVASNVLGTNGNDGDAASRECNPANRQQ